MGAHAGAHLIDVERLCNVVRGSEVEAFHLVRQFAHHRDEQDRNAVGPGHGLDAPAYLVTVHLRHQDVEQHEIGRGCALHQFDGFGARIGDQDVVFVLQDFEQFVDIFRNVVNHEQRGPLARIGALGNRHGITAVASQFQLGANSQPQQFGIHRLGDVIGDAEPDSACLVRRLGQRGDKDDRNPGRSRIGLQLAEHRIAVHARHFDVEQNQVGLVLPSRELERLLSARGGDNRIAVAQDVHERMQILVRVIDDEDARAFAGDVGHDRLPQAVDCRRLRSALSSASASSMANTSILAAIPPTQGSMASPAAPAHNSASSNSAAPRS